jgi:hypothetical protein
MKLKIEGSQLGLNLVTVVAVTVRSLVRFAGKVMPDNSIIACVGVATPGQSTWVDVGPDTRIISVIRDGWTSKFEIQSEHSTECSFQAPPLAEDMDARVANEFYAVGHANGFTWVPPQNQTSFYRGLDMESFNAVAALGHQQWLEQVAASRHARLGEALEKENARYERNMKALAAMAAKTQAAKAKAERLVQIEAWALALESQVRRDVAANAAVRLEQLPSRARHRAEAAKAASAPRMVEMAGTPKVTLKSLADLQLV